MNALQYTNQLLLQNLILKGIYNFKFKNIYTGAILQILKIHFSLTAHRSKKIVADF